MAHSIDVLLSLSIPALVLLYLFAAPHTKVEESFNVQAIHDILKFGIPSPFDEDAVEYIKANYDHASFPGSVPRTFVGAAFFAGAARPFVGLLNSPDHIQVLVRTIIGVLNAASLVRFRTAVDVAFGKTAGRFYLAFIAVQFHILYYASRALPNMIIWPLTTEASRALLLSLSTSPKLKASSRRRRLALYLLTVSGIVFRSEVALLLVTIAASLKLFSGLSISKELLPSLIAGSLVALPLTLGLDTFLWRPRIALVLNTAYHRVPLPVWPELQAFLYNTVSGHASDWGVSPWHSYFTSSLPKLLLNPVTYALCTPLALSIPATRRTSLAILTPVITFIALYSLLPHKEWRFIIYTLPLLTATSAAGASWAWTRRTKSTLYRLLSLLVVLSLPLSLATSLSLAWISSLNYPGGVALSRLHDLASYDPTLLPPAPKFGSSRDKVRNDKRMSPIGVAGFAKTRLEENGEVRVHLDNLATQTGVTRFQEVYRGSGWVYDKTENQTALLDATFWDGFDFVVAEDVGRVIGAWDLVESEYGFDGIGLKLGDSRGEGSEGGSVRHSTGEAKQVFMPAVPGQLGKRAEAVMEGIARHVAENYSRGYWPHVRMRARLHILKKGNMPS